MSGQKVKIRVVKKRDRAAELSLHKQTTQQFGETVSAGELKAAVSNWVRELRQKQCAAADVAPQLAFARLFE